MYFSAASRITQASETFFWYAMLWSVANTSGGKLAVVRDRGFLPVGFRPRRFICALEGVIDCTTLHHNDAIVNAKLTALSRETAHQFRR